MMTINGDEGNNHVVHRLRGSESERKKRLMGWRTVGKTAQKRALTQSASESVSLAIKVFWKT